MSPQQRLRAFMYSALSQQVYSHPYDRAIVGTAEPKWEGGMTQRFSFRGFDFTVVAFARCGYTLNSSLYGGNFVNTYQGTYNN